MLHSHFFLNRSRVDARYAKVTAVQGCGIQSHASDRSTIDDAVAAASSADATVILIGLDNTQEGEGHDRCVSCCFSASLFGTMITVLPRK